MAEPANDLAMEEKTPSENRAVPAEPVDWDIDEDWEFEIGGAQPAEKLPLIAIGLAALGWTAAAGWAAFTALSGQAAGLETVVSWIAIFCAPLAMLGILWLLVRQSSAREARRFGRTAQSLRAEAKRLDYAMRVVRGQLAEMRGSLADETDRLMALGDETAGRLGDIGGEMHEASATIEDKARTLEKAAKSARADIEVLISNLPRAEEKARAAGSGLREAGVAAHEQAGALETQLAALKEHSREADETAGGAAKRLAAHLARIEGVAEVAARKLDETGAHIDGAVDGAVARSSEAVDSARRAVDEIGRSLQESVANAERLFASEGETASAELDRRITATGEALDGLAARLEAESKRAGTMIGEVDKGIGKLDAHLGETGEHGDEQLRALAERVESLRGEIGAIGSGLSTNDEAAGRLIERAAELRETLERSGALVAEQLPAAMEAAETQLAALKALVAGLTPEMTGIEDSAGRAAGHVEASRNSLAEQREALDRFIGEIDERVAAMREALDGLAERFAATGEQAASITDASAPQLVEALMQVREAADQAAEHARKTFGDVIPQSAQAMGEATRKAMREALGEEVEQRMQQVSAASETAIEAAREAGDRLTRQLEEIAATSAAIEERAEIARSDIGEADQASLARSVTLLIESLNSIAIDVTKILSNEVTDTEWAAYLKGDRGIFARRAVRLLDSGEAREIVSQYEHDGEFREQVNRYIHDFEAMLRQVLATRGGSAMAVTLLSSDNGKLYVALAQAIDRFRSA